MISRELKTVILGVLKLDDWEIIDTTTGSQVPGWDSLSHINIVSAVEKHFGVHFKGAEVLRLKNVGDLQRLVDSKVAERHSPAVSLHR
jgi:acyl carrier protein